MSFRFQIENSGYLKASKTWFLDGKLLSGVVKEGSMGELVDVEGHLLVKVKSVASVNADDVGRGRLTLSIEAPSFAFEILRKGMILEEMSIGA
ncbi:MAG: hypothetical protein OEU26_28885 [Candidatus Tectomicrobia bacterium]|nr:hypothetical protein [Candidatus Tectomicrobia bacterium]